MKTHNLSEKEKDLFRALNHGFLIEEVEEGRVTTEFIYKTYFPFICKEENIKPKVKDVVEKCREALEKDMYVRLSPMWDNLINI